MPQSGGGSHRGGRKSASRMLWATVLPQARALFPSASRASFPIEHLAFEKKAKCEAALRRPTQTKRKNVFFRETPGRMVCNASRCKLKML